MRKDIKQRLSKVRVVGECKIIFRWGALDLWKALQYVLYQIASASHHQNFLPTTHISNLSLRNCWGCFLSFFMELENYDWCFDNWNGMGSFLFANFCSSIRETFCCQCQSKDCHDIASVCWISLVPHKVAQQMPQLTHVASCVCWRAGGKSMWGQPSTNHNSLHGRVVAVVMPLYVAQHLFVFLTLLESEGMKWTVGLGNGR